MADTMAGSSLSQAHAENVHREHHPRLHHTHNHLRRLQLAEIVTGVATDAAVVADVAEVITAAVADVVTAVEGITAVTQTVSVIQQIQVDSNGNTVQISTYTAGRTTTADAGTAVTTTAVVPSAEPLTTTAASPEALTGDGLTALKTGTATATTESTPTPQSLQSSQVTSLPPTASSFPTVVISNSSSRLYQHTIVVPQTNRKSGFALLSSSSSLIPSNYSSTVLSFSNSTSTTVSSSPSSSSTSTADLFSVASFSDDTTTSTVPTATASQTLTAAGGGAIATNLSSATTTAAVDGTNNNTSNSAVTPTPVVVGSVVGSVAGMAVLVFVVLLFLRWNRRHKSLLPLGSGPDTDDAITFPRGAGEPPSGPMTERSLPFAIPSALASLTGYKRSSHQPSIGASSTAGSERGFYRVSGRKITSVLESGGDGWGNDLPEDLNSLGGSSFYRDSRGFHGGHGGPPSPLGAPAFQRDSGVPVSRPSPARTPVISQGPFATLPFPPDIEPPRRPDAVGRSHASHDGSKGSRFTEEV
jgi:hypothetical protein